MLNGVLTPKTKISWAPACIGEHLPIFLPHFAKLESSRMMWVKHVGHCCTLHAPLFRSTYFMWLLGGGFAQNRVPSTYG